MYEDDLDDWYRNPVTQQKAANAKKAHAAATESLLSSCSVSGDPSVRAAYERYQSTIKLMEEFNVRKEKHG